MPEQPSTGSGKEAQRTPWETVSNETPLVEDMGAQLYAAFGTIHQRLQVVALTKDAPFRRKKVAALSIWGLQKADRLLALRQTYKGKDIPPHEIDRFRNLKMEQVTIILRMQRVLLSTAKALKMKQEQDASADTEQTQAAS